MTNHMAQYTYHVTVWVTKGSNGLSGVSFQSFNANGQSRLRVRDFKTLEPDDFVSTGLVK